MRTTASGPTRTTRHVRSCAAYEGRADIVCQAQIDAVDPQRMATNSSSRPRKFRRSEIRLICLWHRGVLSWGPLDVFGADHFAPWANIRPISDGRRPGRCEHTVILYGKVELQHLAAVVGIDFHGPRRGSGRDIGILFGI